ncbi:josephin [Prochlorococcus marinus]|uniref:Josephin n=1 Tax=Prochlorococcus marinus XMU1408 TaxID=2213228 RepID=A0A318R3D7_PROMR|nr:josephin [Prochlorococcus marinus]MBW3041866.1 josephin [Prochlorococcus marinus str. XMU1408]PYE03285.1 josephin [Prochlorococcus marinus XMU1408]
MTKSVNLYLASGVSEGIGFWLVNFTEDDDICNSLGTKLLECYRKELFGLEGAIEVKEAINTTLDILAFDSKFDRYKLEYSNIGYSSEIPINIIEDIFDLWAYNYNNKILWKKYIGLLKFRKKIKTNNNYINIGLKGDIYEFAIKLEALINLRKVNALSGLTKFNESMW